MTKLTVVVGEVSSLAHESGNDTVEGRTGESKSLLSGTKSTEVLSSPGNDVGPQFHNDTSGRLAADGNVEINLGIRHDYFR